MCWRGWGVWRGRDIGAGERDGVEETGEREKSRRAGCRV